MDCKCAKSETGLQVFSRLLSHQRSNFFKLDTKLLPNNGPHPTEIIEIKGESNVGKTTLLLEIIAKFILPLEVDGKNVGVIFIDTDNFQILKLLLILEKYIKLYVYDKDGIETLLNRSLKNLKIVKCFNIQDFQMTLLDIDEQFVIDRKNAILAIDSIGAFYWTAQQSGIIDSRNTSHPISMQKYIDLLLKQLKKTIDLHRIVMVYTKQNQFGSITTAANLVNYRIELMDLSSDKFDNFMAKIEWTKCNNLDVSVNDVASNCVNSDSGVNFRNYTITCNGINWMD